MTGQQDGTRGSQIGILVTFSSLGGLQAIRDGVIEASINHEKGYVQSKEMTDIYSTREPQLAFHQRISFCLDIHNMSVKVRSPWLWPSCHLPLKPLKRASRGAMGEGLYQGSTTTCLQDSAAFHCSLGMWLLGGDQTGMLGAGL